jgi:hypothetical protein
MTEPRRSDRPSTAADAPGRERDAHVEELLLTGLDHYFAGHYDLAISVWTRVLFLNHGHARARAYIERARSAIAERQREGEELLHSGVEAFVRGDGTSARRLLTNAVERGAASEEALAVLDRLNRLEAATGPQGTGAADVALVDLNPARVTPLQSMPRRSRLKWMTIGIAAGILVAAAAGWVLARGNVWPSADAPAPAAVAAEPEEALPVPTASEAALARARALHAQGHPREALSALDALRHGDPLAEEANTLRATIQRELLAAAARAEATSGQQRSQVPRQ